MQGTVKKIIKDKGFGFIADSNNVEYFFHNSALKNIKFNDLKEGQEVTFEESENAKGMRADDIYV